MRSIGTANGAPLDLDEQRGHDRQRERQPDLRGGALPELGVQQHLAAELADRRAHRVHADAAAGDVAGDLGGGEAGVEEQLGGAPWRRSCRPRRRRSARARRPCGRPSAGSMPRPSSRTEMITLPPAWRAEISSVPVAGLPAATRSSAGSRPWSSELRTRCTSGSPSASTTVRSSSVSLPTSLSSTCLSSFVERSRTSRGKRRKTASTGIIRTCMTICCRACDVRVRFCIACERPGTSAWAARPSTCVRCSTSSPM